VKQYNKMATKGHPDVEESGSEVADPTPGFVLNWRQVFDKCNRNID
jgi:hypothetical protein